MTIQGILEIILIAALLAAAALTAAAEISIISVSRIRLRRLASDGSKAAKVALKMLETPERFFGAILVSNNIFDTLIASVMTGVFIILFDGIGKGVIAATVLATFLIIVFEVTAKTLAAKYPEKLSLMLARPVSMLIWVLLPVVKGLTYFTNIVVVMIAGKGEAKGSLVSDEEIRAMIKVAEEDNALHKEKYRMLNKIFEFSETVVRSVMTPKNQVVAINIDAGFDEIINKVLESGYSRLPVFKGTIDNIIGIISMKDLLSLLENKGLIVLQDIIYPHKVVPSNKKVPELLKEFQKGHTHLAIVSDVPGKLDGVITLEDLLEEIVGEIQDESDIRANGKPGKI